MNAGARLAWNPLILQCGTHLICFFALAIVRCGAQKFKASAMYEEGRGGADREGYVSEDQAKAKTATVIKKYANRRLYNTSTSTYVTLEDLSQMVRSGSDFVVFDAKTGEDITRSVLTQIIFEEENKGSQNLLPINFLRQLIRFYGDTMQGVVPSYLEMSLDTLMKDQDKIRKQMSEAFGGDVLKNAFGTDPMKAMEEITQRNMTMFQDAMRTFNPFAAAMGLSTTPPPPTRHNPQTSQAQPSHAKAAQTPPGEAKNDDLQQLKDQMAAIQDKLNSMSKPN
jgi:polyhydroxyalkanoate synthesis repressor PhaR